MAQPPQSIVELAQRFERNQDSYRRADYKEAELRAEFIDPFFEALGWDMRNRAGKAEAYKDVIFEEAIKVGVATKAPDYCFRIGGTRKFFVETKRPSVELVYDYDASFQLRRYAWSSKLPISVLTNFKEFALYDCRYRPSRGDKASDCRIMYIKYDAYAEKWDEIAAILSKEGIEQGAFDKYAEATKGKRGTSEVDSEFLAEIEKWRSELAHSIARRNPKLTVPQLNGSIQSIIDRLVFLRMCEDRGMETYGRLQAQANGEGVYRRLVELFYRADEKYNSGLFHFSREAGRSSHPDELTPDLEIDDAVFKEIIGGLYYPRSPYEFSVISPEILGNVYEQFLGKVIRRTPTFQVKVEEKPEVRKAGGVYYTPEYIVEYIVRNTVGRLCEGKTPAEIARLRVLDPACGSGSFLLGAYKYLLNYHRDWYVNDGPEKHPKEIYRGRGNQWFLTTAVKKQILLNSIYGVDIDPQAVEVTKLSLLLKVLEDENEETLNHQLRARHLRALPDLDGNVKCGNSLIGPDFYEFHGDRKFSEEERQRINAFDWKAEFPDIFKRGRKDEGGFDAVIGNPPYIRIQALKKCAPAEVEFYKKRYKSAAQGNYDIYVVFVERGLDLLEKAGLLGFILPHKFFNAQYGRPLRRIISGGNHLNHVVYFGDQQVFEKATTYTCLLFLDKAGSAECNFVTVDDLNAWRVRERSPERRGVSRLEGTPGASAVHETEAQGWGERMEASPRISSTHIPARRITDDEWSFSAGRSGRLVAKLQRWPGKLDDIAERMGQGIRTSANDIYVLKVVGKKGEVLTAHSDSLRKAVKLERKGIMPFLHGRDIKAYRLSSSGKVVVMPYTVQEGRATLLDEESIRKSLPLLHKYLAENRRRLAGREKGRMKGSKWYGYVYPKNIDLMRTPKILVPDIADRGSFALDETGEYAFTSGYGITLRADVSESPKYVLALLNSSLLDFQLKRISTTMRGGFVRYFTQFIKNLPMRRIDFADHTDKSRHAKMVKLVDRMLALHKKLAGAKAAHEKMTLEREIKYTDAQIDKLVYELYGLTEEEIAIVEGAQ